jgi:hypothetical protein
MSSDALAVSISWTMGEEKGLKYLSFSTSTGVVICGIVQNEMIHDIRRIHCRR